ncbi:MAG: hypothetical protein IT204_17240 [Fimbriimonadaceae bacterium]|nr:hypothetical protein [Fimbriimonadaceae bacterium]
MTNRGPRAAGALYYNVELPDDTVLPGLARDDLRGRVEVGAVREVRLTVDASACQRHGQRARLLLQTLTRRPSAKRMARDLPAHECWAEQDLAIRVEVVQAGPLVTNADALIFGHAVDQAKLELANWGDIDLPVELHCEGPFEVLHAAFAWAPHGRVTLKAARGGEDRCGPGCVVVTVRPTTDRPARGCLYLRANGLPEQRVVLERQPAPSAIQPARAFTVGIDFGTSKTAVAWVDNRVNQPEPQMLEWNRPSGLDPRYLPSAVFDDGSGILAFGDAALEEAAVVSDVGVRSHNSGYWQDERGQQLYVGMKLFLHAANPLGLAAGELDRVVEEYFHEIFRALQERSPVDLSDCTFVLSVPVLRNEAERAEQERRTIAAAAAAGDFFDLEHHQFQVQLEPLCAAVDILDCEARRAAADPAGGQTLHDHDWLCVFDVGAGTTDICFIQARRRGTAWQFRETPPIGYVWGGDQLDTTLYQELLRQWTSADHGSSGPDIGPAGDLPDGARRASGEPEAVSLFEVLSDPAHRDIPLRFRGAKQDITVSRLLGQVVRFKELHLSETSPPAPADVTTRTPVENLHQDCAGTFSGRPLNVQDLIRRQRSEFLEMQDGGALGFAHQPKLRVKFERHTREHGIRQLDHVCAVGGTTLANGFREALALLRLSEERLLQVDPDLRRLHVARGAALFPRLRVELPLPETVTLRASDWRPGAEPRVRAEVAVDSGTPPSQTQQYALPPQALTLERDRYLLFEVLLGERVVRRVPVGWFQAADALSRAGLPRSPELQIRASLAYVRWPQPSIRLEARWLLAADQQPVAIAADEASEVVIPQR